MRDGPDGKGESMKKAIFTLPFIFLFTACASNNQVSTAKDYEEICLAHSRDLVGEVDEQARYEECMALHDYMDSLKSDRVGYDPHLIVDAE